MTNEEHLDFLVHTIRCWAFRALAARQFLHAIAANRIAANRATNIDDALRAHAMGNACVHAIERATSWEASATRWYVAESECQRGRRSPFL